MPTAEHESPIALVKLDPGVIGWLLTRVLDVKIPTYHHTRLHPTDVQMLVPRTYHADGMLLFCDVEDRPLLAVILEVQRGWDGDKFYTWPLYVAPLRAELKVGVALVVYCPRGTIASRYRDIFAGEELSLRLRPFIFTPADVPLITDLDEARESPAVAVLAALCHGKHARVDAAFPALLEALRAVGPDRMILYYDIVLAGLRPAARTRWEAFMSTTVGYEYRSEMLRELAAQHEHLGEAHSILKLLRARGLKVSEPVESEILACTDPARLDAWLLRAPTVLAAEDLLNI